MKVETHNHPTAISPWPGAGGSGGESAMKAPPPRREAERACGLSVSNLRILGFEQPWEEDFVNRIVLSPPRHHDRRPVGGAAFNNEFGRPALNGYFRT